MIDFSWIISAFLMGLLGGTHCVGMCGGLSSAFTFALPPQNRVGWRLLAWQLLYNSGRLSTYALLGLLAGGLLFALPTPDAGKQVIRLLAGLFMVMLGAYLAGWFQALAQIERIGAPIWKALSPLRQRLFPITHPGQAVFAGMVWGLLPCGLVYSAMALAATRGQPTEAAFVMLVFGLGTLPTLLITGTAASQVRHFLQRPSTRQTAGMLAILFGLWTILGLFTGHMDHADKAHHEPATMDSTDHHHHH